MNILRLETNCLAKEVRFTRQALVVTLSDGRSLTAPLTWYPRLLHGTPRELAHYELIGDGEGIRWPELDEDLSVEGLLAGRQSQERQDSLRKWLESRNPTPAAGSCSHSASSRKNLSGTRAKPHRRLTSAA